MRGLRVDRLLKGPNSLAGGNCTGAKSDVERSNLP